MEATKQYIPEVLFCMPFKVVQTFESVIKFKSMTIPKKATEQYFSVVLFIMLYCVARLV